MGTEEVPQAMARKNLAPETVAVLAQSKEARLEFCEKRWWIDYPRALVILQNLERLLAMEKTSRPPCMLVVGSSNNGKTTLARKFYSRHPVVYDEATGTTRCPVVFVPLITRPDVREFYHRLLQAMGVPYGVSDHPNTLRAKAERLIETFQVRMVVIDEMNYLAAGSGIKQREILAQIRALSSISRIPVVCFTTKVGERMANYDPAFYNRFRPEYLPQWTLDIEWQKMLAKLEGYLPLPEPSEISRAAFAEALWNHSSGLLGEVHDLLRHLSLYAIRNDKPCLTPTMIAESEWMTKERREKVASELKD